MLVSYRIGYPIPMFAGFCIMFISTISKCVTSVFPGRHLWTEEEDTAWGVMGSDNSCWKKWVQRGLGGVVGLGGLERSSPRASVDTGLGSFLGSVCLLYQLCLPTHRQVTAGHRVFLLVCGW